MTARLLLTDERLLLSKAGKSVGLSMPEGDKAFDSEWAYGGQLIAAGFELDPNGPVDTGNGINVSHSSTPWVIDFPECGFIPTVVLSEYQAKNAILPNNHPGATQHVKPIVWERVRRGLDPNLGTKFQWEVTSHSIIMTRASVNGFHYRYQWGLYYRVYGF